MSGSCKRTCRTGAGAIAGRGESFRGRKRFAVPVPGGAAKRSPCLAAGRPMQPQRHGVATTYHFKTDGVGILVENLCECSIRQRGENLSQATSRPAIEVRAFSAPKMAVIQHKIVDAVAVDIAPRQKSFSKLRLLIADFDPVRYCRLHFARQQLSGFAERDRRGK